MHSGAAAGGDCITNTGGTIIGLDGRVQVEPMWRVVSESAECLEPLLNSPRPARLQASTSSRNDNSGAVPIQRGNDEYNVFRQMREREREKLSIDRVRTELRVQYDLLKGGKSSKSSDAYFLPLDEAGN